MNRSGQSANPLHRLPCLGRHGLLLAACLLVLVTASPVHADRQAAARRLLAITDVAREFELAADRQTEAILRTYADIVSTSANRTLPESIRQEIARCYQEAFAWERFEAGIAEIFADNFSEAELQLLLDFFSDRSVPPPMISQFRAIIARAEAIEQQTIDYLFSQTEGCDESNVRLILDFLDNP